MRKEYPKIVQVAYLLLFIIVTFFYSPYLAGGASLIGTEKQIYNQGEAIKVSFSNSPGNEGDWICIAPAGSPDNEAGDYKYMPKGLAQGVLLFDPPAPGKYEVRAYFDYQRNGYVVSDRYAFSVMGSPEGSAAKASVPTSTPPRVLSQGSGSSGTVQSMTTIKHEPITYFVAGKRIKIVAEVTDPEGIKLVRCYFKGKEQADFVFVGMTAGNNTYTAILPAAAQTSSSIDYLFLSVNNKNQVVKTQQFRVNKDDSKPLPPWQDVAMEGQLSVSTELAQAPAALEGFTDSIVMDVVESAFRFGFVAEGIYMATQIAEAGGATGTAATATSAGTATVATGAGLSTGAIVGVAAGVAVAGGVGVAAAGGSKSSSSSSGGGSSGAITQQTLAATWGVTGSSAWGGRTSGTMELRSGGTGTYTITDVLPGQSPNTYSGTFTWSLNGSTLTLTFDRGAVYQGSAQGNSSSFSMTCSNGWTLNFTRR